MTFRTLFLAALLPFGASHAADELRAFEVRVWHETSPYSNISLVCFENAYCYASTSHMPTSADNTLTMEIDGMILDGDRDTGKAQFTIRTGSCHESFDATVRTRPETAHCGYKVMVGRRVPAKDIALHAEEGG